MPGPFRALKIDKSVLSYLGNSPPSTDIACLNILFADIARGNAPLQPHPKLLGWYSIAACNHHVVVSVTLNVAVIIDVRPLP